MRINHLVAAAAFGAIALAACSSGSYSSGSADPKPAAPIAKTTTRAAVASGATSLGDVLVDSNGMTLYGFTMDSAGTPTCVGACATTWPPLTVAGASLPAGLNAKLFSVVGRPDGSHQLAAGRWPLYRFAGDTAQGDVTGQGTEGFFVVMPNGSLKKS